MILLPAGFGYSFHFPVLCRFFYDSNRCTGDVFHCMPDSGDRSRSRQYFRADTIGIAGKKGGTSRGDGALYRSVVSYDGRGVGCRGYFQDFGTGVYAFEAGRCRLSAVSGVGCIS